MRPGGHHKRVELTEKSFVSNASMQHKATLLGDLGKDLHTHVKKDCAGVLHVTELLLITPFRKIREVIQSAWKGQI